MQSFVTWFLRLSMVLYFQAVTCLQLEANQVVLKDYNMSLVCTVSTKINTSITIQNPSGNIVTCSPTGILAARCSLPNYVIDETAQTVTLTRLAALSDDGNWTCEYRSNPVQTKTINIIVETLVPINDGPLYINTTAAAGETFTSATNDVFSAIYGCFSSAVKFKWKLAPDSWQIVSQASTAYTCATPGTSAYVSTQTASEIWSHLPSGTKQTLSVTVLTMDNYELSVSTFSVYFSKGDTKWWCGFDTKAKCDDLFWWIIVFVLICIYVLIHWVCCNANIKKCHSCWCCHKSCYCKCPEKGFPCCPHHFDCCGQDCSCCNPLSKFESDGNIPEGTNNYKKTLMPKSKNNVTPSYHTEDTISGDHEDSRNNSGSSNTRTPRSTTSVSDVHTMPSSKLPIPDWSQTPKSLAFESDVHPPQKGSMRPLPLPENYQPNLPDPSTGGNNKT